MEIIVIAMQSKQRNRIGRRQLRTHIVPLHSNFGLFFLKDLAMKKIPLTQGQVALVDDEDYEYLCKSKWCAFYSHGRYYAVRTVWENKRNKIILMHRQILNPPKGKEVDHINHNGLDNRKKNIRIATRSQNNQNQRKCTRNTTSKYKGVSWDKKTNKWISYIKINCKRTVIGYYHNEIFAAGKYDEWARKCFGSFANTNF